MRDKSRGQSEAREEQKNGRLNERREKTERSSNTERQKKGITEIKKKERKSELLTTDSEEGKKRKRDGRWEKNIG